MSGSGGANSRASNALLQRAESIKKWKTSQTAKEKAQRLPEQFTIKFEKGTEYSVDVDNEIYKLIPCKKYLAEYQEDIGDITYRSNGITKDRFYNTFIYTMRLYKTIDQVTKLMEEEGKIVIISGDEEMY